MANTTVRAFTNHKGVMSALKQSPDKGHLDFKHTKATGLKLRVYSTGNACFVHRYTFNKKETFYRFPGIDIKRGDNEPTISKALADAVAVHAQQRASIKGGVDPSIERDLQADELATMPTVAEFASVYIEKYAKVNKKSWSEDDRQLEADVINTGLGRLALDKVKRSHLVTLLDKKQEAGAMVARNRLISLLSKFFNFAIERGHVESNPVIGIKRTKEKSKERALSNDDIVFLWMQTSNENKHISPVTRLALRLILITGQRPGEVRQMKVSQIKQGVWYMDDTKNGKAHAIPLSELALEVIKEAKPYRNNGYLFPGAKKDSTMIGINTLPRAMKRMEWPELPATAHDLRRTAITEISRLGFNRLVQDKIANHVDNSIGGVYDRHDYMKEKQQALDAWSRKLSEVVTGHVESNVVQLRTA